MRRILAALLGLALAPAHAADEASPAGTVGSGAYSRPADDVTTPWTVTTLASHGSLSGARADWVEAGTEVLYRAGPGTYAGARAESRERNNTTDALYTALVSVQPVSSLEVHASVTAATDPHFSADETYAAGVAWRAIPRVSLLMDVSRLEFPAGAIDQHRPGAVWWFNERTFLTGRYTGGEAFGGTDFELWSLRLDAGNGGPVRVALGYATGEDPEKSLGAPAVTLTEADTYSAYAHWRVRPRLELIAGLEYEDRAVAYTRTTGALGFSARF